MKLVIKPRNGKEIQCADRLVDVLKTAEDLALVHGFVDVLDGNEHLYSFYCIDGSLNVKQIKH